MSDKNKADAYIAVSKHRVDILLEALKRYPNKSDPIYKEMVKELEDVESYWKLVTSIEIKKTSSKKEKYVKESKKLTGEAARRYLRTRGVRLKESNDNDEERK